MHSVNLQTLSEFMHTGSTYITGPICSDILVSAPADSNWRRWQTACLCALPVFPFKGYRLRHLTLHRATELFSCHGAT